MKRVLWYQRALAGLATFGLVLPSGVGVAADATRLPAATPQSDAAPKILDVSLGEGGVLAGQLVDGQGLPLPGASVSVRSSGGQTFAAMTDREGRFQFANLQGGLYEVSAAGRGGNFRLWSAGASPPGAVKQVMLVSGETIARGQFISPGYRQGGGRWGGQGAFLGGVIVLGSLGGVIAGGIIAGEQGSSS
jgi:hypothetical protein